VGTENWPLTGSKPSLKGPFGGEQLSGPQHEAKPAASLEVPPSGGEEGEPSPVPVGISESLSWAGSGLGNYMGSGGYRLTMTPCDLGQRTLLRGSLLKPLAPPDPPEATPQNLKPFLGGVNPFGPSWY
jgi:hypothetical protein